MASLENKQEFNERKRIDEKKRAAQGYQAAASRLSAPYPEAKETTLATYLCRAAFHVALFFTRSEILFVFPPVNR